MSQKSIMAVLDVETTGLKCTEAEMIELCVYPVTSGLEKHPTIELFKVRVKADRKEFISPKALEINGLDPSVGDTKIEAYLKFKEWTIKYAIDKIKPIGQYYTFDQGFIAAWMKEVLVDYSDWFGRDVIDTKVIGAAINMSLELKGLPKYFDKLSLKYMSERLGINYADAHGAQRDCEITLEVLKEQMKMISIV